jgi:cell division protein FtsI (penicillin-binding protein 3)
MPGRDHADRASPRRRGLAEARRYTPRGRTVRELGAERRAARSADPFRPALEVAAGGRGNGRDAGGAAGRTRAASGRVAAGRVSSGRGSGRTSSGRPSRRAPARLPQQRRAPARRVARRPVPPPRLGEPRRRLRIATVIALAMFTAIGVRLVHLQLTDAPRYAAAGLTDRLHWVELPAPRGAIYDRNDEVLAHSVEARAVYADPTLIEHPEQTAAALSPLLGIAASDLLPKLVKRTRPDGSPVAFVWLARGVDIEVGKAVEALDLDGIVVTHDERREVPGHDLAANLLGFTGDDMHGLEGIEAHFDELLYGVDGRREYEVGLGDLAAPIPSGYYHEVEAKPGSSLQLTIDRDLQYRVQQILAARMRQVSASLGAAVVLDIKTGEVLAQASYPAYDAADPLKVPAEQRVDVATGVVFDPGSVHKAIVLAAALEEGLIHPDTAIEVGPTVRKGDQTFRDTTPLPRGTKLTLPGILAYSSNVGTIAIADMLGPQKLYEYQRRFGLGERTDVGVPGEAAGQLLAPEDWSGSSYGSVPIGHSVAVTAMQMAAVYATIANDGVWVRPHLVRETIKPDGTRVPAAAPQTRRVISAENAAALREMLEAVVTVKGATGRAAAVPGYRVAGKTGTGERVGLPGEVASFIGMAPADAPRYVIAVFAHTPGGGGGTVTAPAFREMMEFTLLHYRVPPTGTKPPEFVIKQ